MNVDKTGISLSWKTASAIATAIVAGAVAWTVFTASLARKSEITEHDLSLESHPIVLSPDAAPISQGRLLVKHDQAQNEMRDTLDKLQTTVLSVRNGFFDARAEDFAYRVVDKMPDTIPYRQRQERFEQVKARVRANLEADRDIRDGLSDVGY